MEIRFLRGLAGAVVLSVVFPDEACARTTETTARPAVMERSAIVYSYSGKTGYKHDETPGETFVQHFAMSGGKSRRIGEKTMLSEGSTFAMNWVSSDEAVPAPARLGELSLNIGARRVLSPACSLSVFARPGYYGDFSHCTLAALNMPAMAAVSYAPGPSFTWLFGAGFNRFGRYVAMPALAFRWKFAEDWTLDFGLPRLGLSWQAAKSLELGAHATMQGGAYRTTRAPRNTNRADLANTQVSYQEIRLGVRVASLRLGESANGQARPQSVSIEGGWMALRRFDYHERDYTLKGKPSAYVTVAINTGL